MSLALMAVFLVSCTDEVFDDMNTDGSMELSSSENNNIMEFSSKEDFLKHVENGFEGTRANVSYNKSDQFISLMDTISPTAEILNELSEEERNTILQNKMTYYEAFGYEDILPNENVAKLINIDGEVIVDNSLYRINDVATFTSAKEDAPELREYLRSVNEIELRNLLASSSETKVQLTPKICAIKSYEMNAQPMEYMVDDDGNIIGGGGMNGFGGRTGGGSSNGSGGNESTENLLNQIPFSTFPTYSAESRSWFGRLFDGFNMRHNRHHEFKKDYRVTGSLYDYNYGFYRECGAYVSMDRKRGGVLKFINGWKDINADKLVLHMDHIVLETKIDISNDVLSNSPTKPVLLGTSNYGTSKQIELFGRNWSKKDIDRLIAKGAKELFNALKKELGTDIPDNTRSVIFVTPQKLYKVICDKTFYASNKHKIREVFSSGSSFVISYNSSSWAKTLKQSIQETLKNPSYHIIEGQVKLAGKLNNNWGGIIIYK